MFRLLSLKLLRMLRPGKSTRNPVVRIGRRDARRTLSVRPQLECLERRDTPSVTNHFGGVLANVEVQPMFYGVGWATNATNLGQALQLGTFLNKVVNSSYMDMLTQAGYGVGRGSTGPDDFFEAKLDNTQFLTDAQIQGTVASEIAGGHLRAPDANRLYVVFVQPNVAVENGQDLSVTDFLGYHSAFVYQSSDVHYAVVAYPGGSIPLSTTTGDNVPVSGTFTNGRIPWLGAFDQMTQVASHELAESVTDPNIHLNAKGWNDDSNSLGEVGDLAANQTVYLNGYAVQRIADQNDQAMTPAGATSATPVDFVLKTDGTLWVRDQSGFYKWDSGVASISDQGVDDFGEAMVDVIYADGSAYEFHHEAGGGGHLVTLADGSVKQAVAGQGVSYVLLTSGNLYEFKDAGAGFVGSPATFTQIDSGVKSIDAGTDKLGVNMVTEVRTDVYTRILYVNGVWTFQRYSQVDGYEVSDSTGKHPIASNIKSLSAGQQGNMAYITTGGVAYSYSESTALWTYLGSGAAVTAGTDASGSLVLDLVYADGSLLEWRQASGWTQLAVGNVTAIGKAHAGALDIVFSGGAAWKHSDNWYLLSGNAVAAA